MQLNERAQRLVDEVILRADELRVGITTAANGTRIIDCGIATLGGLEAGRILAEVCLAGLGQVDLSRGRSKLWSGPSVAVTTDHPLAACMASQYAGWQIASGKFFAMGSGPMRAAGSREPLLDELVMREKPTHAVGVLETRKLPPEDVCAQIAEACGVRGENLTLLVAPTASLAGTIQVVARSVETALHKMHAVGFPLAHVVSGFGTAPLPPVAAMDLAAIGRTNDAVLYGGEVTLWLRDPVEDVLDRIDTDEPIRKLGPLVPSSSSPAYGRPFIEIFEASGRDFYKIDPLLFSPAVVHFVNLRTGRTFTFGETNAAVIRASFGG